MISLRGDKISHMYRRYKSLKEVSLELAPGECFALFGPNGAGKTTLMKIFATLLRPTEGTFEIMGKDGLQHRDDVRRYLFYIGHGSFLYDNLTVVENVEFTMGLRGWLPTLNEIRAVLDRVGLGPFGMQKGGKLSAGMKKRLALAKALLAQPDVLLLDEAYDALDERGMNLMNECIRDFLRKGKTVFLSSHDRAKTAEVAHRAAILQNKKLREIPVKDLANALF